MRTAIDHPRRDPHRSTTVVRWAALGVVPTWDLFVAEDLQVLRTTLVAGWAAFALFLLWRITRAVEHLAFGE